MTEPVKTPADAPWAVVTHEPGVYVVGSPWYLRPDYLQNPPASVWLFKPVLMYKVGNQCSFKPIGVVGDKLLVNLTGQLGAGVLQSPYLEHYQNYLKNQT